MESTKRLPEAIFCFLDLSEINIALREEVPKAIQHHVLQPKPTIHRVRHAFGKARRARANVQDKDNDNETSMHYLVRSEDSEKLGGFRMTT